MNTRKNSAERYTERHSKRFRHASSDEHTAYGATSSDAHFSSDARRARREASRDARSASFEGEGRYASNPYSRSATQGEYTRQRKKKKRRTVALVVLLVVLVLVLGAGGAAFAYIQTINHNMQEGITDDLKNTLVDTQYAGDPFYMLLMGTDGSEERANSEQYAGDTFRSDSMMLVRVDPEGQKVTMVSLHRDTMIDMGVNGMQKLNAAHSIGGAAYTVQVVSEMAGVDISHYAEIDFDGFKDIVDALGGVEVDVPMEIDDWRAGGYVAEGLQTLDGEQALILCRARHAYDDYGDGDRYRAANQRLVMAAIAKKVLSSDPATMVSTVEALSQYVTTDFEVSEIVGLAQNLRGIDVDEDIYSAMEPTTSEYINSTWYEHLDEAAWREMMSRVDQGLPPTEEDEIDQATGTVLASAGDGGSSAGSSANASANGASSDNANGSKAATRSGTVSVRNGTGISGLAAKAADEISALGYTTDAANANSSNYQNTVVVYNESSQSDAAKEIAQTIGISLTIQNDGAYAFDTDFLVVIGADWA